MKKCAIWVLLFAAAFSLFAQTSKDVKVYISPVEGTGSTPEDNEIFTDTLIKELAVWNFTLTDTQEAADFTLSAAFSPSGYDGADEPKKDDREYELSLSLLDKEGVLLYQQSLRYTAIEEVMPYIPSMLFNMFSSFFVMYVAESAGKETDPEEWRNKSWYIGESVFWSPRLYHGSFLSSNLANFGFGFSAEFHFIQFASGNREFLKYVSAATGMEFVPDWVVATDRTGDEYRNTILQIPLRFSYVWRPGALFMHQPFLGIHFNVPFYKDTTPALLSWDIGFQFGLKAGPGIAYAHILYSMDFGDSGLNISRHDARAYQRYVMQLGIGYKYDLVGMIAGIIKSRPPKPKPEKAPPPEDIQNAEDAGNTEPDDAEKTGEGIEEPAEENL